jgi:mono/diheme cytochrome c family protein
LRSICGRAKIRTWLPPLALAAALAVLGYPAARSYVLSVDETPAARGERLAAQMGCFACHGAGGTGGVQNTNARFSPVPGFRGARGLQLSRTLDDVHTFVADGAPAWRRGEPGYEAEVRWAALRMPAYREVLGPGEIDDLAQYIWLGAVGEQIVPTEPRARRGAALAQEQGCFNCHGELGAGGRANPGSLKGYIPGFWGADFEELVRDDHELRQWLEAGEIERIAQHPIGKRFFRRQRVVMPPFGQYLSADDLDALVAYVRWLHREAPARIRAMDSRPIRPERVARLQNDDSSAVEGER